jgi:CRISPR-associated protein Csa1
MYFLSDEERRYVLRRLIPQARANPVHPELRGWNWDKPPLAPIYDVRLGVYEVAGQYCDSARDLYLRRVTAVRPPPNAAMIEGQVLHAAVVGLILKAKRSIYAQGTDCMEALLALAGPDLEALVPSDCRAEVRQKAAMLWSFEHRRVVARIQEVLAHQPHIGPDGLAALALPVVVEQKLDGRFLGLSAHLSADAFMFSEPMMVDIKFGAQRDFHRLTSTGYALVMESLYEYPIDLGCIVYPSFQGGWVQIARDFHLIDDELRQWFIEARDERMRLVAEEIDPGLARDCYESCPYWPTCHPSEARVRKSTKQTAVDGLDESGIESSEAK